VNRNFGEILGDRKLHRKVGRRNRVTTVTLGMPRRRKNGDWECPFQITGQGIQYGYGVDAIQSLTTALEGIRVMLERSGQSFSWLGGDYTGFDRLVTSSFGTKFTTHLNRIIDREIERFVNGLERAHKKRQRRRA
jgi:hypothetical protein